MIKPVSVNEIRPGVFIFDMGQNFAGVTRLRVKGPAGTQVKIRYGEDKYADGSLNVMTAVAGQIKGGNGGPGAPQIAWQKDSYTLKGSGTEEWSPRFTFHGFRFIEVTGWPGKPGLSDIEGLRMNADLQEHGSFSSSNEMFNKLGDLSGPLGFQIGFPYLIKKLNDFYGDKRLIEENYAALTKHIKFLESCTKDNLFITDLGDHESLDERAIPLTASIFYYLHAKIMNEFAGILKKKG